MIYMSNTDAVLFGWCHLTMVVATNFIASGHPV